VSALAALATTIALTERKAAGNVVELGSIAAFGFSPLGCSRPRGARLTGLPGRLVDEMKRARVLARDREIGSGDELLGTLGMGMAFLDSANTVTKTRLAIPHREDWEPLRTEGFAAYARRVGGPTRAGGGRPFRPAATVVDGAAPREAGEGALSASGRT
jgi:hypothetical protein